jgi:hypothetical protein
LRELQSIESFPKFVSAEVLFESAPSASAETPTTGWLDVIAIP